MSETQVIDISEEMSMNNGTFKHTVFKDISGNVGRIEIENIRDDSYYKDGYWESDILSIKGGSESLKVFYQKDSYSKLFYKYSNNGEVWTDYQLINSDGEIPHENIKMIKFKVVFDINSEKEKESTIVNLAGLQSLFDNVNPDDILEQSKYSKRIVNKVISNGRKYMYGNAFDVLRMKKIDSNKNGDIFIAKVNKKDFTRVKGVY